MTSMANSNADFESHFDNDSKYWDPIPCALEVSE